MSQNKRWVCENCGSSDYCFYLDEACPSCGVKAKQIFIEDKCLTYISNEIKYTSEGYDNINIVPTKHINCRSVSKITTS